MRRGTGRFALTSSPVSLTAIGGSGLVAFQPLSGEALVVSGVTAGGGVALAVSIDAAAPLP